MSDLKIKKRGLKTLWIPGLILCLGILASYLAASHLDEQLVAIYRSRESQIITDRNNREIFVQLNSLGYRTRYLNSVPPQFERFLLQKEDKYFYFHTGFNPVSISRAALGYLGIGNRKASSTISQQLVKILLGQEFERTLKNKIIESFYTLSLELRRSKDEILKMYLNSLYLGNQTQGLAEASRLYFNLPPELLTEGQMFQILATISGPAENNPARAKNVKLALSLAQKMEQDPQSLVWNDASQVKENMRQYTNFDSSYFEIKPLLNNGSRHCRVTIDKDLTEKIREIVQKNIDNLKNKNANNAAVVVIKLPENEILALIGSPDPESSQEGYKINMLTQPRPIGSTIKPFIYLKAFEAGLRPYTLVNDREYKYITALGFPLYPKNFDWKYRGEISLHYALSNSLNVPAVKVLEYVGLEDFYHFLEEEIGFEPVQDLNNYQLGIALGALEMSLMDLTKYFTIFPNEGILKEIKLYEDGYSPLIGMPIAPPEYTQLINKILSDRATGIEQFGLKSELNLLQYNYALKTGTSRDFKDSWIVGYTPDFLVGVWVGNADNTPTREISGQTGAGAIWAETMNLIFNSQYNLKTPFEFDLIKGWETTGQIEYGLSGDNYEELRNALKDSALILNPHDGDVFLCEENINIILESREKVNWFINNEFLTAGQKTIFAPKTAGEYKIKAENTIGRQEIIGIFVTEQE